MSTKRKRKGLRSTKRSRLGKQALIKVLNDDFQEMMHHRADPGKHLFFQSIKWWKAMYATWPNESY